MHDTAPNPVTTKCSVEAGEWEWHHPASEGRQRAQVLAQHKREFRGSAGFLRRRSRAVVAGRTSAASVTCLGRWIRAGRH
eukprot:3422890-Prymnesium_polylepis.1